MLNLTKAQLDEQRETLAESMTLLKPVSRNTCIANRASLPTPLAITVIWLASTPLAGHLDTKISQFLNYCSGYFKSILENNTGKSYYSKAKCNTHKL